MQNYRSVVKSGAPSGAATTIYSDRLPRGHKVYAYSIVARDETSAVATNVTIGVENNGQLAPLKCIAGAVAALITTEFTGVVTLQEDDRIYATFEDATAGDVLYLGVFGEIECKHGDHR
jgi:hypothetical protein